MFEGHQHDAGCWKSEEGFEVSMAVRSQECDSITGSHTQLDQSPCEAIASVGKLLIGQRHVAVDDGNTVAETAAGIFDGVGQGDHPAWRLRP